MGTQREVVGTRRARHALVLKSVSLATCALFGCTGTAKRETAILISAVDGFRRAEAAAKNAEATRVAAVTCTDESVCDAKRACVAAIDPTTRALSLKEEVERRVQDIESKRMPVDSPEARGLPGKLDEAEALLKDGRQKMASCDRKLAELQLRFGM
jgi:hypothetical protein